MRPRTGRIAALLILLIVPPGCDEDGAETDEVWLDDAPAGEASPGEPDVATASEAWVEYAVHGAFEDEAREEDVVMCSEGDEGHLLIVTRGRWYLDMDFQRSTPGEHGGEIQATVPEDVEGAPAGVFARRMSGEGVATIRDTGRDAMGFRKVEVEFAGGRLENGGGREISVTGRLVCGVAEQSAGAP